MKWLLPAALVAAAAVLLARHRLQAADAQDNAPDQIPGTLESLAVNLDPTNYLPAGVPQTEAERNERAFLDTLAYSEGTSGPDGYRMMFGGGLVDSLADHPRQVFEFTNSKGERLKTTAAGRYQFLARTWDDLRAKLDLPDFGPASQDAAALELIRQRGALRDVQAGRIAVAIAKCAPTWASLPGAGYNQPERKLSQLVAAYQAAGGNSEA